MLRLLPSSSRTFRAFDKSFGAIQGNGLVLKCHTKLVHHQQRQFSAYESFEPILKASRSFYLDVLGSQPVTFTLEQLCAFHDLTGLPWWSVIASITVSLRLLLMLPAHITSQKTAVKRKILFVELDEKLIPQLGKIIAQKEKANNWSKSKAKAQFDKVQKLLKQKKIEEYNCSSAKMFLPFYLQIPLWISVSLALRRMSTTILPNDEHVTGRHLEFSNEGLLWIPDLCLPDPTMAIPLLVGGLFLLNIEITSNNRPKGLAPPKVAKYATNFFRLVSFGMIPVACVVPSAMSLYWTMSAFSGVMVNLIIMSPKFRSLVNMPKLTSDTPNPYRRLINNMRENVIWYSRRSSGVK